MSDTYAEDGRLDREAEREEFEAWWQALDEEELEAWCEMLPRKEEEDEHFSRSDISKSASHH